MKRKRKNESVPWETMPMGEIVNWVNLWSAIDTSRQLLEEKPEWRMEWERLESTRPQWERDLFGEVEVIRTQAKDAACDWIDTGKVAIPKIPPFHASRDKATAIFSVLYWWAQSRAIAENAPHARKTWLAMIPREAALLVTRIQVRLNLNSKPA